MHLYIRNKRFRMEKRYQSEAFSNNASYFLLKITLNNNQNYTDLFLSPLLIKPCSLTPLIACHLLFSCCLTLTLWTVACQAPPSMRFPRQEYWSRLPFPSPGDLPDPGIEPTSAAWQVDSLLLNHPGKLSSWSPSENSHP